MREVGKFRSSNGDTSSSTSGFNNHMNFSSGPSSSTRYMPSIAEDGSETVRAANQENVQLGNRNENGRGYAPGFSSESWNDSAFSSLKRNRDGDLKIFSDFNGLENQVTIFGLFANLFFPFYLPSYFVISILGWRS